MLTEVDEGEFAALRDALDVSDSVLSKQLKRDETPAQAMPQLPGSTS